MEKLKMHSKDKTQENFEILQKLFPNAVTETIVDGEVVRAIDKDVLQQEINAAVVEGKDERYQFTWPDKKRAIISANAPINKTLRPCREESVDFDNTENLYIEGDNLEVLKLLQETYLGKIKMIYIDPPYNTGKDFVYSDKYSISPDEWDEMSGELDEYGNRLVQNNESNGRFHTDWLNMIYPRLKIARDLLTDDGVIFISIDEKEEENIKKIANEVFGKSNHYGDIVWESTTQPINAGSAKYGLQKKTETILMFGKNKMFRGGFCLEKIDNSSDYPHDGKFGKCRFEIIEKSDSGSYSRPSMKFKILGQYPREGKRWQIGEATARELERSGKIEIVDGIVKKAVYPEDELNKEKVKPFWSLFLANTVGTAQQGKEELNSLLKKSIGFDTVKPVELIRKLITYIENDCIVMDFFSGSGTTAHAVIRQNFQDVFDGKKGKRKFIMVQLPEKTDEKSDAYKAGYKNICEIGKERIRRAGKNEYLSVTGTAGGSLRWNEKRKEELGDDYFSPSNVDIGFRVLKLDSSNMKDVYYNPADFQKSLLDTTIDNIKEDRTPEDLLFQVMLDLGVLLSEKIEENEIAGKKVFNVANGYLIACFDSDVNEEVITAVAKQHPIYFVMRDSSISSDTTATNFDQIFETYSPDTVRKVI